MSGRYPKIVALLPIKRHSARIEGKNFKKFNGKPLFRWMLETLLSLREVDQVVINTDACEELVLNGLPKDDRILLRERDPKICGDFVSMNLVIADDVNNIDADIYMMTHVTNPLLSTKSLREALNRFIAAKENLEADSLFTVNRVQSRFYRQDGSPINHNPAELLRTQDLEPWFEENSNLYVFTKESFAVNKSRIGAKPLLYEMPHLEAIDIDDNASWDLAETISKRSQI